MEFARRHAGAEPAVTIAARSRRSPRAFPNRVIEMPNFSTDSAAAVTGDIEGFRPSIVRAVYEEAGIGPDDVDLAEVYDLSAALELDWYEDIGLCGEGEAEKLLADGVTSLGGRVPVNPSGGLSSFGEAIPAQAIAQVCEAVWQLRGQAPAARSRAPGWRSPPTRASSATARRCSSRVRCPVHGPCGGGPSSTKWSRRRSPRHGPTAASSRSLGATHNKTHTCAKKCDTRYVDFRDPIAAVIPGVQGRVLTALARTETELTMRTVAELAGVSANQPLW